MSSTINYKVTFNDSMSEITVNQVEEIEARLSATIAGSYGGNEAVWKLSTKRTDIDTNVMNLSIYQVGLTNRTAISCTRM
jgi:hypothetical protein